MKKIKFTLLALFALLATNTLFAQLATGDYYFYNEGAGLYLNYGGNDDYTACFKPHGEPLKLSGSNGQFTVQTALDSRYLSATATSENARQTSGTTFTFTQQSDGTYTISSSAGLMGYGGTTAARHSQTIVQMNLTDGNSPNARWRLFTREDLLARFESASESNPVDATFLITCPNFDRHHSGLTAWTNNSTGSNTGYLCNNSGWVFNTTNVCSQTINNVPNGIYLLKAQAFYRHDSNTNVMNYNENTMPKQGVIFMGDDETYVLPILSEANLQASNIYSTNGGTGKSYNGKYIPYYKTSGSAYSTDACIAFDNGLFAGNEVQTTVINGTLTIGARIKELTTNSWIAYDNFELYYLGPIEDISIFKDQYYDLRTLIQEKFIDQTAVYTDESGATDTYGSVRTAQDAIVEDATTQEEIENAMTALWNAALSFMKVVSINEGQGFDLTWMIKDADFSDTNYKSYWNEVLTSSTTVGVTNGIMRYYNCSFDLSQTLPYTMPAGAYRMKVDGFERTNDPMNTAYNDYLSDNSIVTGTLYLNDNELLIKNLFDVQSVTNNSLGGEQPSEADFYVPNGSSSANKYLQAGYYPNTLLGVIANDGPVTIGYRCANTKAWTAVDNFKLWYIGEVPQVSLNNEADEMVPVCAPFTLSTEDTGVEELYALGGENNYIMSIYPVSTIPAGTPCYAKFSTANYSAPMEMTLSDGKKFVLPWTGGLAVVDAANTSWTYYDVNLENYSLSDIEVLSFDDMRYSVNLENFAARRYTDIVNYDGSSDASEVAQYNVAPPTRRDIPNAVMIPLPPHNDEVEVTVVDDNLDIVACVTVPAGASEAYFYNLQPQKTYYFQTTNCSDYRGRFDTKGRLRMVYAPSAYNIRDLGGWETQDNCRTTYGHLFRGSTLNGYVNCTPEDIQALKDLGIGGEIDLRYQESYDKDMGCGTSAFGFGPDDYYFAAANDWTAANLNESGTQQRLKAEFDFILDHFRQGKAVYYHCAWGADRTGMLSFLLEGLLGLTIDQIYKDYELTSFSAAPGATNRLKTSFQDRIDVILALDGATLRDKFENYFINKLGVSMDDITYFRSVMLETYPLKIDEEANVPVCYDGDADITLHRTLKAGMHNTIVLPCDLPLWKAKYYFGNDAKMEKITAFDEVLVTEEISEAPANIPFLLIPSKVNADNNYLLDNVKICEAELQEATFTGGKLVGSYAASTVINKSEDANYTNYVISNDRFYYINNTPATMKSTRAYLVLETPSNGVKSVVTFGDGIADGIQSIDANNGNETVIYDLSGRRVKNPARGLYIINGKKQLVY